MLEGWLQCFTLIRWTHRPGYCIWCHASKNRLKPHSRLSVTGDWFSLMMQDGVSKVSSARVIRQHISLQMYSLWFVRKKVGANNVQCFITTRVKATTKGAAGIQSPPPVPPATPSPQRWRGEERRGEESAQLVVFSMLPVSSLLFLEILSTGRQTAPGTTTPTSQLTKVQSLESSWASYF